MYSFLKNYGINFHKLNILCMIFGLKKKKIKIKNSIYLVMEKKIDTFLKINLLKKEYIIKLKTLNLLRKIENGSYKGYKFFRGLPLKNQRTKTNSRTTRKKLI